ncbi:Structure-specific endonuclease subunit SLX4 [Manis javanica]|nr:Structure-specific endonuclease subunit SLX4 [Manis javanica]
MNTYPRKILNGCCLDSLRKAQGELLLLQAVQLQAAQLEGACSPPVSSFGNRAGGLKRKGAAAKEEPQRKRKACKAEVPSEDLLVAMALSWSEMEQEAVPAALRLGSAVPGRTPPGAEKKSRKKKAPISSPQLLVQGAETTQRQIEDWVAQLFAEEAELSSMPPLPRSRILKEELEKASQYLPPPKGKQNFLWKAVP